MRSICALLFSVFFCASMACAQEVAEQVSAIVSKPIQSHEDVIYQLREYLMARAPRLPKPVSAESWTARAEQTREHLLNDVIFHGWPRMTTAILATWTWWGQAAWACSTWSCERRSTTFTRIPMLTGIALE